MSAVQAGRIVFVQLQLGGNYESFKGSGCCRAPASLLRNSGVGLRGGTRVGRLHSSHLVPPLHGFARFQARLELKGKNWVRWVCSGDSLAELCLMNR